MDLHGLGDRLQKVEALDRLAAPLMKLAGWLSPSGPLEDALAGRWLGHPAHPPLTDLPIGAWTSALALDLLAGEDDRRAADLLIALGILGSIPTAAAGLTDWKYTDGGERRAGSVHALANVGALITYTASLTARTRGRRGLGKMLSAAGWTMVMGSAWLGGYLSFSLGIGTDETAHEKRPTGWTPVLQESELGEGAVRRITAGEAEIMLTRRSGRIFALANTCSHRGGPLHEGAINDTTVVCPWHGSCFTLEDGEVLRGPAAFPQPTYESRLEDGNIEVRAR